MMADNRLLGPPYRVFDFYVPITNFPLSKPSSSDPWEDFSNVFRREHQPLPQGWADVFGPLRKGTVDDCLVVGQLGQSLDGRVATESVVVGVGTAIADDPQLTVRRVSGPQPARVVIDPKGRLCADARMFADNGVRRLLITEERTRCTAPAGVEVITLPKIDGQFAPSAILAALAGCGMSRMLIEGGADTISRFLVAPIILGNGGPGIVLPSLDRADQAPRMPVRVHKIDDDVLFDCDLSAQRVALGIAKKST